MDVAYGANLHVGKLKKMVNRLLFGSTTEQDFRLAKKRSMCSRTRFFLEVHLQPNIKWKGDLHLGIIDSYDTNILLGQDLLVLQGDEPVGLARSLAPGWEWAGTPGRLAKMHQKR